ncbi:ClpXP protease specificity-enhancing factor SspB [Rhodopseudomonas sp. RCAM05734]
MKATIAALLALLAIASPVLAGDCAPEVAARQRQIHNILSDVADNGLHGAHHYSITFLTTAEGVTLPAALRAKFPHEMTIVLQYQFARLKVADNRFDVVLWFKGVKTRVGVPFDAITLFIDPAIDFRLEFDIRPPQRCSGSGRSRAA